jgi:hypothetical protein
MILTRVWYLFLVIAAVAGLALAMVAVRVIDERSEEAIGDGLRRDRFELEAILKLDARSRIDAIAPLAADGAVRTALREATGRRAEAPIDAAVRTRLTNRLTELNRQLEGMSGDLLIAVDANGIIVAQIGGGRPPEGAGLGAFPLVRRALDGYVRDDVWILDTELFRMAARPVIDGQYVGAIIHGKRIDSGFAQLLSTRLVGASVGFFFRDRILASAMADPTQIPGSASPPTQGDMAAPLAEVLAQPDLAQGERTDPVAMPTGGLAVYSLLVGSAAHAQAGYVIARPIAALGAPSAILEIPTAEDWAALPWALLAGLGVLALLIAMLFVWLERDRPLGKFRLATQRLAKREVDKLIPTEFAGPLRGAAANVNEALEKIHESAASSPKRKPANLDDILGPVPEQSSPAFFGFAGGTSSNAEAEIPAAPPPSSAGAPASAATASSAEKPAVVVPPPAAAPPKPPGPPPAGAKPPAPPPPTAAKPAAPPAAPPPAAAAAAPSGDGAKPRAPAANPSQAFGGTLLGLPAEPGASGGVGPIQAPRIVQPPPPENDEDEEGATMVARVPEELLAKSAAAASENEAEEAHFREVYDQFVATKKQCGEAVAGLTYGKFVVTLRKNREQIVKRHDAAKVRFTVYVKDGKAALKATPIRD